MKNEILTISLVSMLFVSCNNKANSNSQKINSNGNLKTKSQIMKNENYTATIMVDKNPTVAFNAIKNFRAWWSEEIEGKTDELDEEFFYHYKDIHLCKLKLIEMVPDKKLVYQVLENEFNFVNDKSEWVNTKLIFEITKEANQTKVQFTHDGLVPTYECYKVCNDAWTGYIKKSLYNLITTGKGEPNPKDKDGFNAELAEKWQLKSSK
jgi:hypothetical protein